MIIFLTTIFILIGIGSRDILFIILRLLIVSISVMLSLGEKGFEHNLLSNIFFILIIFLIVEFISMAISKEITKIKQNNDNL